MIDIQKHWQKWGRQNQIPLSAPWAPEKAVVEHESAVERFQKALSRQVKAEVTHFLSFQRCVTNYDKRQNYHQTSHLHHHRGGK